MDREHTITVFVENEAGSDIKHHYNEQTLEPIGTERVGGEYPYPYGFIPGTLAPDGDCADCFIITEQPLATGTTVECSPVALLEQTEGGITDHNVIAVPAGQPAPDLDEVRARIGAFLEKFMLGVESRKAVMGRTLSREEAAAYLAACSEAAG